MTATVLAEDLARKFNINSATVRRVLRQAGVPVVDSVPYGKGTMRIFELDAATDAMEKYVHQRAGETK